MQSASGISNGNSLPEAPPEPSCHSPIVSQPSKAPQELPESPTPSAPCSSHTSPLERRIATLEREKADLARLVTEAENETAAAKLRAQDRYTEKLHAYNEVRHLQQEIKDRDFRRKDYMIKIEKSFRSLRATIAQLETEKSNRDFGRESKGKIEELEGQLNDMQAGFVSSQEEKAAMKIKFDQTTVDLKKLVLSLKSSLTAEQKRAAAMESRPTAEELQARVDAAKADVVKDMKAKWQSEIEENKANFNQREKELVQSHKTEFKNAKTHWQSRIKALEAEVCARDKKLETAKKELELLRQQLHRAMHNNMQTSDTQQHLPNVFQQASDPNKKRKLDASRSVNVGPQDCQRDRTQCVPSSANQNPRDPRFHSNVVMSAVAPQRSFQQSMGVTLNGGHGQHSSPNSNARAGPSTPSRIPRLQNGISGSNNSQNNTMTSQLGSPFEFQPTLSRPSPQQQRPYVQGMRPANMGSKVPNHSQLQPQLHQGQTLRPGLDIGVAQNVYGTAQAPLDTTMYGQMYGNSDITDPFLTPMQATGTMSSFGNEGLMATTAPANEVGFRSEYWGCPAMPNNPMSQGGNNGT